MSKQIDWSKAPEGATHYVEDSICPFEKRDGDDWYYWNEKSSVWIKIYNVCGEERIKKTSMYMVERPSPSWSGEGLPPVGVVCEMHYCGEWEKTEILCIGVKHVFIRQIAVTGEAFECSLNLSACQFRPIRTPEQIAAGEREAAIDQMINDATNPMDDRMIFEKYPGDAFIHQLIGCLYSAGYRKP